MKSLLPWVLCHPTGKLSEDGNGTVTGLTRDHLGTVPMGFPPDFQSAPPCPAWGILWGGPGFLGQRAEGVSPRAGQLSAPMRDRFGVILRLELYSPEELARIVKRSANILNVGIDDDGALEVASRSRGTPRIANRLLKRARDYAEVMGDGVISVENAQNALARMEIDELGLDLIDRNLLTAMIENYNGGPVGLETISALIGEESVTIEDVYEPYLMQLGFLTRTPRGRKVTPLGYRHLGLTPPTEDGEQTTFKNY